jgi:uncharacterized paraquat-inducible protein A
MPPIIVGAILAAVVGRLCWDALRPAFHRRHGGELCENCGRVIRREETPHLYHEHVVCVGCAEFITKQPACPKCASRLKPRRTSRWSWRGALLVSAIAVAANALALIAASATHAGDTIIQSIASAGVLSWLALLSRYFGYRLHCAGCGEERGLEYAEAV